MTDLNEAKDNANDPLLTNEIVLNVSNWFEIFYNLNANLFLSPPLSPKEWINELSSKSMSPNLNLIFLQLIQLCGIKSRKDIKKPVQYLPNTDLIELLFNECIVRENLFILHCKIDTQFNQLMKSKYSKHINKIDTNNNNTNSKQEMDDSENEIQNENDNNMEQNDYGIPWQYVQYNQLPLLYKVSILQNFCDWILMENKTIRKLMNSNKKSLIMEPIFIDDNNIKYYLFGSQSLLQCLYRQKLNENKDKNNLMIYDFDGYIFKDENEIEANTGMYFGDLECIGIGMNGIKEFTVKIDRNIKPKLYNFLIMRINNMELLEKKKLRAERRKKTQQNKFSKDFAFNILMGRYNDDNGNRRSNRTKDRKKVSYVEIGSDGEEENQSENENENQSEYESEENDNDNVNGNDDDNEEEDNEPAFYPSGRLKRKASNKKK